MEQVCEIFPLVSEKIMKELDYQSLTKFKMASRETCEFLENGRVLWKQMILKNIKGTHVYDIGFGAYNVLRIYYN